MGQTRDGTEYVIIPSTVLDMEDNYEKHNDSVMEVDNDILITGTSSLYFKTPDVPEQNFSLRKTKPRLPSTFLQALVSSQHSSGDSSFNCRTTETCFTPHFTANNGSTVSINIDIEGGQQDTVEDIGEENDETNTRPFITDAYTHLDPNNTPFSQAVELLDAVASGEEEEVRRVLCEGGPHLLQVYSRQTRSSPLHLAASLQHDHLVTLLMTAGCNIESFDVDGNSPLHICCLNADTQTASALLSASSNTSDIAQILNARNYRGLTCFLLAASSGNASLMTLLARAGCDVNIGDGLSGRTALHHAATAGNILLVRFLLQTLNADVNRRDFGGNTALGLVEQHRRQDLALLLIRHGGEVRV